MYVKGVDFSYRKDVRLLDERNVFGRKSILIQSTLDSTQTKVERERERERNCSRSWPHAWTVNLRPTKKSHFHSRNCYKNKSFETPKRELDFPRMLLIFK